MEFESGPTGKIVVGHVLDVNRRSFSERLREFDPLLYAKWNAKKNAGWGTWEIRRRPEKKSIVDYQLFQGAVYLRLEYREVDIVNHIMDVPYLNYSVLDKLKQIDAWENKEYIRDLDYREAKERERQENLARQEFIYNMKQYKREIRDLKEHILSGNSPNEIAKYWGSKKPS